MVKKASLGAFRMLLNGDQSNKTRNVVIDSLIKVHNHKSETIEQRFKWLNAHTDALDKRFNGMGLVRVEDGYGVGLNGTSAARIRLDRVEDGFYKVDGKKIERVSELDAYHFPEFKRVIPTGTFEEVVLDFDSLETHILKNNMVVSRVGKLWVQRSLLSNCLFDGICKLYKFEVFDRQLVIESDYNKDAVVVLMGVEKGRLDEL
jgi:hypothetical protein